MSQVSLVILSCLLITLIIPDLALAAEEGKVLKDNKTEKPKTEAPKATPKPEPKVPKQPQPKPKIETQEPKEKPQPKKAPEPEQIGGKYIVEVGVGGCRGKNWNTPPYPINQGRLSKSNCAKVCIENGCSAFHMLYEEDDGTAECFLFGHNNVLTVARLGGQCYALSDNKPSNELIEEDDSEEEQEITGPVYMAPLGKGRCRGPGWTFKKWPVLKGYKSAQECAEACAKRKGCTAFDVSDPQKDNTYDCALYGHVKVAPASGVPGICYVLSDKPGALPDQLGANAIIDEEEEEDEEEIELKGPVHMALLGKGRCRGKGWTHKKWPVLKGFTSPRQCAEACAKKKGCTAFDLSDIQADNTFDCALYGHSNVAPASGVPGNCYILSEKEGVVPGGLNTVVGSEVEEDDDEELELSGPVHMAMLGKGRCRGPGWTFKKWPILRGFLAPRQCAEACAKKKGCKAFDLSNMQEDNSFDCTLYGHQKVVPAKGVPGNCYILSEKEGVVPGGLNTVVELEEEEDEEENVVKGDVDFHLVGAGRCRGSGWTFKKWPVIKGNIKPKECAIECAKKKGCTAFDVAPMQENINECALYGHKKVSPASGVPGECFQLGEADEVIIEENIDIPEIDDGVKHKHKHLGYGMCRGAKWTDRIWPLMRGYKTLQECANSCGRTKGCTAFDISKEDSGRFDCMLYGHKHPVPAPGVPGDCYTIPGAVYVEEVHEEEKAPLRRPSILDEDEEDYTNIEKVELLGKGACRGKGWQDGQWPLAKGRKSLGECADICKKTAGCVAFDLSNKDGEKYDCLLLGHPSVLPASGLAAKCYIIQGAKPVMSTLIDESKPGKKAVEDSTYPPSSEHFTKIGLGRCRGQGWQDNGFPKDVGKKNVQECSTSCQKTKGCSAFDLSNEENKKFDCLLFGHKHVIPASSQSMSGACYTMGTSASAIEDNVEEYEEAEEEEENDDDSIIDIEGDVDITLLGKGGCRGGGWQNKDWPKVKGFTTIDNCGRHCVTTKGCTAFHSASLKEGSKADYECFLFGHKSVIPAAGLTGNCYSVSKGAVGSQKLVKTKQVQKQKKEKKKVYKIPEFEEPKVVDDTFDEEDEDWLFDPPPPEIRSRDHIAEILGLSEKSKDGVLKVTETTLKELKKVYETSIKGLEKEYKYKELSNRHFGDPEMFNKPLIVLLGPWSGGKSTMINYLLGTEYTKNAFRSTAEPSPGFNFNIAMYGDNEEEIDGTQLSAEWAFSSLQKFGQEFLKKLRGKKMPNKLLEKATFAEIPGVLETGTIRKIDRRYPFNDACQWFIDHADLIILVYDYAKLDIGPETEALLDQLKGRESQVRIVLNKADEITAEELLKIQGNLVWNVSPLMASMEPPTLYAGSFWSRPYKAGAPKRLLKSQEMSLLKDIKDAIDRRVENRIATARRFAVRVRNHAKMVDCYLTTFKNNKGIFGDKKKVAQDIIDNPSKYHIYEGLSTLTNISRYDLPDPDTYRDFFNVHPLYDFQSLQSTCTFFKGCPLNKLDIAIAYELPEILTGHKRKVSNAQFENDMKVDVPKGKQMKKK